MEYALKAQTSHRDMVACGEPYWDMRESALSMYPIVSADFPLNEGSINKKTKIMGKKKLFYLSGFTIVTMFIVGCSSKVVVVEQTPVVETHVVYSPGENLTALTKVHETEYKCEYPFGGDGGKNLFFVVRDNSANKYSNIYRKDSPTSMSMSQLTGGKNHNFAPSYCAATNKVAFAGRPEGNSISDIYMVNAIQGGALQQVTNTPDADEQYPCLSKDGTKIVYEKVLRNRSIKETEIWIRNLQTNENIQLGLGRTPSFSPDGRSIVFVKYASDTYTTCLCLVNADGSNLTQMTDASMGTVWRPCFSPDGRYIVFQCKKTQKGDDDLYVIDRNGSNLTQLTINKSFDGEPYWSNDGNIYFTSDRGGRNEHYQIWRFRYGATSQEITPTVNTITITTPTTPSTTYTGTYHTVQNGETITDIARRYGVTVKDIVRWNNLMTMTITTGMKLKVSAQ